MEVPSEHREPEFSMGIFIDSLFFLSFFLHLHFELTDAIASTFLTDCMSGGVEERERESRKKEGGKLDTIPVVRRKFCTRSKYDHPCAVILCVCLANLSTARDPDTEWIHRLTSYWMASDTAKKSGESRMSRPKSCDQKSLPAGRRKRNWERRWGRGETGLGIGGGARE